MKMILEKKNLLKKFEYIKNKEHCFIEDNFSRQIVKDILIINENKFPIFF